jgi:hypothetical protein
LHPEEILTLGVSTLSSQAGPFALSGNYLPYGVSVFQPIGVREISTIGRWRGLWVSISTLSEVINLWSFNIVVREILTSWRLGEGFSVSTFHPFLDNLDTTALHTSGHLFSPKGVGEGLISGFAPLPHTLISN